MKMDKREFLTLVAGSAAVGTAVVPALAVPEVVGDIVLIYGQSRHAVQWAIDAGESSRGPVSRTADLIIDCELLGVKVDHIELSERAYRYLWHKDLIDRIRRSDGELIMRTFLGYQVHVPGTAV